MPPRIVFVAPFGLARKGTTRARVLPLAEALAARGLAVRVLVPSWDVPAERGQRYFTGAAEVLHLPRRARRDTAALGQIAIELLHAAMAGRPHIVHCFKPIGYSGALAWWLRRARDFGRGRGRIVVDTDDLEGQGGWADMGHYPAWQRTLRDQQERAVIRAADLVTVTSEYLAHCVAKWAGAQKPVCLLPNAGLPPTHAALVATAPSAAPTLLLYSRFNEFEPRRAAAIVSDVLDRVPTARLLVVGDASTPAGERFLAAVSARGLGPRVELAGALTGRERDMRLASATLALWPFDDTPINRARSPAKLLDLLWLGKAVVAEAVGEVPALTGGAAWLVPAGDRAAAVAATVRLLANEEERAALERRARARMTEGGGWAARAADLAAAYRSLLADEVQTFRAPPVEEGKRA